MSSFNNNRNTFASLLHTLKTDFHAFTSLGIAKGTRNEKQQKKALVANISNAIDGIDTNDFGIRVIVMKNEGLTTMLRFKQFNALKEAPERQVRAPMRYPAVIIFKRKAIRMFPDGQEVSSYYSAELKKTVLFPNQY